jgi:hypothetical protein
LTYRTIIDDIGLLKADPIIVKTYEGLHHLNESLKKAKMIGIDVEHYSSTDESLLIQLFTFHEVFVIDRFNGIHQEVREVLSNLFKSQNADLSLLPEMFDYAGYDTKSLPFILIKTLQKYSEKKKANKGSKIWRKASH